jgi:hypothetical protein
LLVGTIKTRLPTSDDYFSAQPDEILQAAHDPSIFSHMAGLADISSRIDGFLRLRVDAHQNDKVLERLHRYQHLEDHLASWKHSLPPRYQSTVSGTFTTDPGLLLLQATYFAWVFALFFCEMITG